MAVRSWVVAVAVAAMAVVGQTWAVVPVGATPERAPVVRGPVEHLAGTAGGGSAWPVVAVDDAGTATAVWRQAHRAPDGTMRYRIRAARRGVGGRWSTPRTIGCRESSCPRVFPVVGVDAAGAVTAAWTTGTTVTVARRPATGPWRTPRVIATTSTGSFERSSLNMAVARNGAVFVVWNTAPDTENVWAAHRTVRGTWHSPVHLGRGWVSGSAVGASATGTAVVTFAGWGGVRAARFVPGHGWGTSQRIGDIEEVLYSAVAVGRGGRVLVVWNLGGDYYLVRAREMSRRGVWGRVHTISDPRGEDIWAGPVPVIDSAGTESIAYVHGYERFSGVVAGKPVGGTWTRTQVVNRIPGSYLEGPVGNSWEQLAVNRRNDLAAAFGALVLRPHGSNWSAQAEGRGVIAILPRGSALRMWWTTSGLVAQRLHVP